MALKKSSFPVVSAGRKIGLLGGSFNPAHEGHLAISLFALKRLKLDEVWWLVSPQNPLKSAAGMGSLRVRLHLAKIKSQVDPRITATALEKELGTVFTADTLSALKKKFPQARFVWLMGADNLEQIHKWRGWQKIFSLVPIAVFRRYRYDNSLFIAPAAQTFAAHRCALAQAATLTDLKTPVWLMLDNVLDKHSGTALRKNSTTRERIQTRGDDKEIKESNKSQGDLFENKEAARSDKTQKGGSQSRQSDTKEKEARKKNCAKKSRLSESRGQEKSNRKESNDKKESRQKDSGQKSRKARKKSGGKKNSGKKSRR